jgi:vacuolar iron transporter family protein
MKVSERKRKKLVRQAQQAEINEHAIYLELAEMARGTPNEERLKDLAEDELRHYRVWQTQTGVELEPRPFSKWWYLTLARVLGLTFSLRLMERREDLSRRHYERLAHRVPKAADIAQEETDHESRLVGAVEDERLHYAGSAVLGLSDALVELTGAVAGLTFALQDTVLVAVSALITGISAALSMAGSEYLSRKAESGNERRPAKASAYTGIAYIIAVLLLVFPFLLVDNAFAAMGWSMGNAVVIVALFNAYLAVARSQKFIRRFGEMMAIVAGIAVISFLVGTVIRNVFGLNA